jgi:hypothetical protein
MQNIQRMRRRVDLAGHVSAAAMQFVSMSDESEIVSILQNNDFSD